jgi:ribonuclease T1
MHPVMLLARALLFAAVALFAPPGMARDVPPAIAEVGVEELPAEARQTLAQIKRGGPYAYRKDGAVFGNREKRLPAQPRGYYTEYTVKTPHSSDRGARRIVAGRGAERNPATSGEYYYTDDHYNSFRRIRE